MIDQILFLIFTVLILMYSSWLILFFMPKKNMQETWDVGNISQKNSVGENFSNCQEILPQISIVIPAHNEETCIEKTVNSVLIADYPKDVEVIVVNDGSTDKTKEILKKIARTDTRNRLKILDVSHGGKANAINEGVAVSDGEIIIVLDADSRVEADALLKIVKPFSDKRVGAVSGIIKAIVTNNPLAWFQDFEYVLASAWRYVCNNINSTYILPGFAAFRKDAMVEIGGFCRDTLSEDFEIGLRLKKAGYDLTMSWATMYTMVPQTPGGLLRQRLRWGRGTVQVIKKHFDVPFNRKYGAIGMYGIPTQIYWYIHGFVAIPITFIQVFVGYQQYFLAYDNVISLDVARYFFGWFSVYGIIDYVFRISTGEYPLTLFFFFVLVTFCLNMIYNIVAILKISKPDWRYLFVIFFFFPYSIVTLIAYTFPLLYEIPFPGVNRRSKRTDEVNIWEKNK